MSSFRKKHISPNNLKWIITFVLIAVLSIAVIFAFVKIDKNEKTKELDTSLFTYSIGLLDESGEYEQGTTSIYTKNYYSVDGLVCDLDEDATVTYKVCFYDEDKEFLSVTDSLSADSDSKIVPETAAYFRVMITPTNDAEVSLSEISTYAEQLSVTINK